MTTNRNGSKMAWEKDHTGRLVLRTTPVTPYQKALAESEFTGREAYRRTLEKRIREYEERTEPR